MAVIRLSIFVSDLDDVMDVFNHIKVYRSATETGVYAEITSTPTRIPLVVDTQSYEYVDSSAPSASCWYKTSYYNSGTALESSLSLPMQGSDAGLIVSLQMIRDEGFTESELADDRALFLSRGWQSWFEKKCGQWFTEKEMTLLLDGNNARVLWLPIPIISLTELYINGDFTNIVDPSYYVVYNRYYPEDDRRNPRIKLTRNLDGIFTSMSSYGFATGDQNQKLVGTFGYVEEDGSAPFAVKRAILILIRMAAEKMNDSEIDQMRGGRSVEEVTDRHRIKYSDLYAELKKWATTGILEVDDALATYRRTAYIDMARSFSV